MLQYVKAREYKKLRRLHKLWNSEFRSSFPIKNDLYFSALLNDPNFNKDASYIALFDNSPVGFIFIKSWKNDVPFMQGDSTAVISLIFVKKEMRNMGIGSDLLKLAIHDLKKFKKYKRLVVGGDFNGFFPGVPNELTDAPIFFMNKDFIQNEGVVDMIRIVRKDQISEPDTKGLKITIATEEEKDKILKLCVKNNWLKEGYIINNYFENGGTGRRLVMGYLDNELVAIAKFNDKNKLPYVTNSLKRDRLSGSISFAKIDSEYNSKVFLDGILDATKYYLIKRNCNKVIILATKDIKYYKSLGYSAYRYYLKFDYSLKD